MALSFFEQVNLLTPVALEAQSFWNPTACKMESLNFSSEESSAVMDMDPSRSANIPPKDKVSQSMQEAPQRGGKTRPTWVAAMVEKWRNEAVTVVRDQRDEEMEDAVEETKPSPRKHSTKKHQTNVLTRSMRKNTWSRERLRSRS